MTRVALLHGFAGDPATWDATRAELARLLPAATTIAVALPGHGAVPVAASWDANLTAVAASLDAVDAVVGYSLGARVALGLLAAGRVPRAVLISVNPGIADADRPARRAADATWAHLARSRGTAAFLDAWEAQPLFASQARAPLAERAARRTRRLAHDPEQLARSLEVMGLAEMPDYRPALPRLAGRIAAIAGADDAKFLALGRSLGDALGAPLAVLPACGHDPTLEQPAALAAAIRDALGALSRPA